MSIYEFSIAVYRKRDKNNSARLYRLIPGNWCRTDTPQKRPANRADWTKELQHAHVHTTSHVLINMDVVVIIPPEDILSETGLPNQNENQCGLTMVYWVRFAEESSEVTRYVFHLLTFTEQSNISKRVQETFFDLHTDPTRTRVLIPYTGLSIPLVIPAGKREMDYFPPIITPPTPKDYITCAACRGDLDLTPMTIWELTKEGTTHAYRCRRCYFMTWNDGTLVRSGENVLLRQPPLANCILIAPDGSVVNQNLIAQPYTPT